MSTTRHKIIDLRSDTVTRPTPAMRKAMAEAEVGDDVFGEDPTVNRLQEMAAERIGTEAALFVPSGTQSNLVALLTHCVRGDEYIVGQQAHTYRHEGGGAAIAGGIQPQPLDFEPDGTLDLHRVAQLIKPKDYHFARTKLLCLENTQAGKVIPMDYLGRAIAFAKKHKLNTHLDGARVFNASVKLNVPVRSITRGFDSVTVCLSKGLGAPVGSLLCSSKTFIDTARRWRKILGGGMRQAGVIAAAGIVALRDHVARLADDHDNAQQLADRLAAIDEIIVHPESAQTNMVFVSLRKGQPQRFATWLKKHGINIFPEPTMRLVTHLDINSADIKYTINCVQQYFSRSQGRT